MDEHSTHFHESIHKKSTCVFSHFPNGGYSTECRFLSLVSYAGHGQHFISQTNWGNSHDAPLSCSASQYQDPDTVHCSAKLLRDTSFTCLLRCPGQTCPKSFSGLTLSKERHRLTQCFDLGICLRVLPRNRTTSVCVLICVC